MSTAPVLRSGLTWEEFLALPDEPRLKHAELLDGAVIVDPANWLHQHVVSELVSCERGRARVQAVAESPWIHPSRSVRVGRTYPTSRGIARVDTGPAPASPT
jgi:Putative restriction endonuclease